MDPATNLRVSWFDRVMNKDILRSASLADRKLFENIKRRKTGHLEHIPRGERYHFKRLIIEGEIEGGKEG